MWGQYLSFGNEIRIDATIEDLQGQRSIPLKSQAPNQAALVGAMGELARTVRESLGRSDANDLSATAAKPSSQSMPALRVYNEGLALRRQGKHSDALKKFEESTKQDPEFALAYARLAEAYKNLGYDNEADQASRRASALSEALPPREKYFILAGHARILGDAPKAIESYENLLKASPDDLETRFELARLYEDTGKLAEARDHYLRVLKDDPKDVNTLLAAGRVEVRRREPQAALEYLNQALTLAIQFDNSEARGQHPQCDGDCLQASEQVRGSPSLLQGGVGDPSPAGTEGRCGGELDRNRSDQRDDGTTGRGAQELQRSVGAPARDRGHPRHRQHPAQSRESPG